MQNVITMENYVPALPELGGDALAVYEEVRKALEATGDLPRIGKNGLDAVGVEDVSGTLASAEIKADMLHFWKRIPKEEAWSMVVEYPRLDKLSNGHGAPGFIDGNSSGYVTDPQLYRGSKTVKFLAVKGQVLLPAQLVDIISFRGRGKYAQDLSEELKMLELLVHAERQLFWGDSTRADIEWDGIFRQIDEAATQKNSIRIDLRGQPPSKNLVPRLNATLMNNAASPTDYFVPNQFIRDMQIALFPEQRTREGVRADEVGLYFNRFLIQALNGNPETVQVHQTQVLTYGALGGMPLDVPEEASKDAPLMCTSVTGTAMANSYTRIEHEGLPADTYYYWVCPVGMGGRNLPTASAGIACAANQKIRLSITNGDENVLYYEVYRNPAGKDGSIKSECKFMGMVPRRAGAVTTQWDDDGYMMPGCYHAGFLSMRYKEILFKQLLPVVKRRLPRDLMSDQYGILLFGTPIMRVPSHNIHLVNVGELEVDGYATLAA